MKEFYEKCGRKFGEYEKSNYLCIAFEMVDVAQWLEHRIVVPGVVGSTPIFHPSVSKGIAQGNAFFVVSDKMEPVRGALQYENCRLDDFSTIFILNFID